VLLADLSQETSGTATLKKKRTHWFLPHTKSATHLVVIKQLGFAHVGLPNLANFYWLLGDEEWHSLGIRSLLRETSDGAVMYRVSDTVRSIHNQDGATVLDVRQGQMFNLNFVGSRILKLLKNGSAEAEVVGEISREFGVDRDLAENDVREFIETLKKCRLVEEHEPGVAV